MRLGLHRTLLFSLLLIFCHSHAFAQRYLSDYDSTLFIKDTLRPLVKRLENLHFSGYIQPQFQATQQKGAASFEGGNFSEFSNNRFMLRRARIRVDYIIPVKGKDLPLAFFAFQFDVTERAAVARDIFMKLYEPGSQKFSLTAGLFARPFGYELNLSSAHRESPERGRMSQILMPAERDLGAMISFESKKGLSKKPLFKFDIGAFNGPGLSSFTDFDSYKDIISRLILKPYPIGRNFYLSAGLSWLYGGWMQATKYLYETAVENGTLVFKVDSSLSNLGARAQRHYYGADVQLVYKHGWGKTEIRGEYWKGKQPGTVSTTVNPGTLPAGPTYIREFDGAFFYFIQNIINRHWELVAKYDWYDPNTKTSGVNLGAAGTNFTAADIRFSTFGLGMNHYFNDNLRVLAYHNFVRNEKTSIPGFTGDVEDDVFTLRLQFRF